MDTRCQRKNPIPRKTPQENRNLGHASNESVFLQREITPFSTHYKNTVKWKSQATASKQGK